MSIKKYLIGIILGITSGSLLAVAYSAWSAPAKATREIASDKLSRLPRAHVGKISAPILVQVLNTSDSKPENGYYKLVAHISFNSPVGGLRYQWALPAEARVISGNADGEIQLTNGEEDWEEVLEVQVTDTKIEQNILFDVSYEKNGFPLGSSDIFVFRAQPF